MTTKELLDAYYSGFAKKHGWEAVIADDFHFIGGDMTQTQPVIGKKAYMAVIDRFSKTFTNMRPTEIFTSADGAFVLANYDYVFPGGKSINGNVAELWKVKNGKLSSLTIFFDTKSFDLFLKG